MPLSPKGFPVLLSFDLDAETMWTARDPKNAERPIVLSQGAYGWKVGMPRILDLLARYGLKVTFFVPGLVMEQRPAVIEAILKGGHEIAHHSWSHAWIVNLTLEQEREEMDRGIEIIKRMTGRKPVGYRSPAGEFSPHTLRMLAEYGFGYSSNYFDDDSPYLHRIDGRLTDIVEFPFAWVLDDAPFFQYSITLPGRTMQAPSAVFEAWRREFDVLYREDRYFCLAMHPQIIGRPSRITLLEELIQYILGPPARLARPLRRGGRRGAPGPPRGGRAGEARGSARAVRFATGRPRPPNNVEGLNIRASGGLNMASMNFSVPDDVRAAFNKAFAGTNKSALLTQLIRQALEEHQRQTRRARAISRLLELRSQLKPIRHSQVARARRSQRP